MAYSIQRAVSDGTMTLLPVSIEYFDREEISVLFDGVLNARQWAWVGTTDRTLSFTPAVANATEVMIVRSTDLSELRHQFSLGAQFTAESLDESLLQVLHIAQEATERQLGGGFFTDIDMHGLQITNLGAATAPDHAVTLAQYQADASGASAAKDTAVASASTAVAASNSASTSAGAALLSANNADISESNALSSANSASASASTASTKATEAAASAAAAVVSENAAELAESNAKASEVAAAASAAAALHPWEAEAGGIHYDSGNVRIGGVGKRITGDFSHSTIANRVMFQTSAVNGITNFGVIPNGTSPYSFVSAYNSSTPDNSAAIRMGVDGTFAYFDSTKYGAGTYLPMTFYTGGTERMRIDASGAFGLGGANYGTAGQVLTSGGAGVAPSWTSPAGVPAGAVAHFAMSTAPSGWLKANGALVSRTTYAALFAAIGTTFGAGDGATTFKLPDLRGEFLRGWDDGRGVDAGRVMGSWQADEFKSHSHTVAQGSTAGSVASFMDATGTTQTQATGGAETRPRNIAMLACIKF